MQLSDKFSTGNQPLLTIAIPTYNRACYLDLCLKRINDEIGNLSEVQRYLVKVYVSDNASLDDTPEVIAQYQEVLGGAFEAIRNPDNIGPDANFVQCYESAITPYVWIIGDDDVLLPGGLQKVLDELIKNEIDILYVNNYWFKDSYKEKPRKREKHRSSPFRSALAFACRTNVMLTFVSGLIVRSGMGSNYRSELADSNLVQLSWVLPLLRDGKYFAVIEDWVVAAKGGNSGGYELVKVFGNNLKKITELILKDQPKIAKAIQNGALIKFFPGFIMAFRKGSSRFADEDMAFGLQQVFDDNWRYHVFIAPLIKMPLYLSWCYYYLVRLFVYSAGMLLI